MIKKKPTNLRVPGLILAVLTLLTGAGSAQADPYPAAVLADHPVAFWQLHETSGTVAADSAGTFNGSYTNVALGQAGYNTGADKNALSAAFGGQNGVASDSYVGGMAVDFATNQNATFSVEAWVLGSVPSSSAGIAGKGTGSSEQFYLDCGGTAAAFRFFVRNTNNTVFAASGTVGSDGNWHHLVGVCDEVHGLLSLYVDGQLAASTAVSGGIRASVNQFMNIGARQSGTANYNDQFTGFISDVSVYNYALSTAQIQNHYYTAGIPAVVIVQPASSVSTNEGSTISLAGLGGGTPPLYYQWLLNDTPLAGATNATLVISNISAGTFNGQNIFLTVSNAYATAFSQGTTLTISSGVPQILSDVQPAQLSLYNGETFTYSVLAGGSSPFYYQWQRNGVSLPGATNATYVATVATGNVTYGVVVSNNFNGGSVTPSSAATLTGVDVPRDPYASVILGGTPAVYWRLNEPVGSSVANDYAGGHDGSYNNVQLGLAGFSPLDTNTAAGFDLDFSSTGFMSENDNSGSGLPLVDFAAPAGSNAEFSVEAWVNGPATQNPTGSAIVAKGDFGSDEFVLDASAPNNYFRFYIRKPGSGGTAAIFSSSHPDGNWHHLVAVCDEANGTTTLYVDGAAAGAITGLSGAGLFETATPISVGAQSSGTYQFSGTIAEVSIYKYALTAAQVVAHYNAAPIPPYFTQEPATNIQAYIGQTLTLSAAYLGSGPLTNQWYRNSVALAGQTNFSLILTNIQPGTNTYVFSVGNAFGTTNTPGAVVQAAAGAGPAQLVTDVTPLSSARYAGLPLTYAVVASGSAPLYYQWYFNSNVIVRATNTSYSIASLLAANSGNYYCVISNTFGAVASSTAALQVVAAPTNVYPRTILLDHPVAYYRLDETNGSTTGYDFVGGNNGQYTALAQNQMPLLGVPGYNPTYDSDTGCKFGIGGGSVFNAYLGNTITNLDFAVPNGQSGAFSVEAWVNAPVGTIQDGGACVVAKGQGGAEQFALDINSGFRFYVRNSSAATVVNAQGSGSLGGSFASAGNWQMDGKWHHLVGVCDQINSNLLLYVDGQLIGPNVITNGVVPPLVYAYNLNHPGSTGTNGVITPGAGINETTITTSSENSVSIGSRNKNSGHTGTGAYDLPFQGTLDDIALYNYALTPAQVYAHYAVGAGLQLPVASQFINGQLKLTWLSAAALQSASSLTGPWTTVAGATSPYTVSPTSAQQYYRLQIH